VQIKIQHTYSHVAADVDARLLAALQDRWDEAVAHAGTAPTWWAAHDQAGPAAW
jgi:hypothetical protein